MNKNKILVVVMAVLIFSTFSLQPHMMIVPQSHSIYVFYDGSTIAEDSVGVGLDMIEKLIPDEHSNQLNIIKVPVISERDFNIRTRGSTSAIFLFHSNDDGLALAGEATLSWIDLGAFINDTSFNQYYVLSCDSTQVDTLTEKERVLTFQGKIDAKIAALIAMLNFQNEHRTLLPSVSLSIYKNAVEAIYDGNNLLQRLFSPIDCLTTVTRSGLVSEAGVQGGLIISGLEDTLSAVDSMRDLLYQKSLSKEVLATIVVILNLLRSTLVISCGSGGILVGIVNSLLTIIDNLTSSDVPIWKQIVDGVFAGKSVLDIVLEIILDRNPSDTPRYFDISKFAGYVKFFFGLCHAIYSAYAAAEYTTTGAEFVNNVLVVGLDSLKVKLSNLITSMKSSINPALMKSKANSVVYECGHVMSTLNTYAPGHSLYYFIKDMLDGVEQSAQSLIDSGIDYIDENALDNFQFEYSFTATGHWFAGRIDIGYNFKNPAYSQIKAETAYVRFTEVNGGATKSASQEFSSYLNPGQTWSKTLSLSFKRFKGWTISWSTSCTYSTVDWYGDYDTIPSGGGGGGGGLVR